MIENLLSKGTYQNYLLVEGSDDKHIFHHLLDYHQIRDKFKIKDEPFEIIDHERYLDATASHAQELVGWIRKLFDLESA